MKNPNEAFEQFKKPNNGKSITFYVSDDLYREINVEAAEQNLSRSKFIIAIFTAWKEAKADFEKAQKRKKPKAEPEPQPEAEPQAPSTLNEILGG